MFKPKDMESEKLPFQIGEQYEKWEFDLEVLQDRINGYDSYKYIGIEFNSFLNYLPDETELIFNLDVLECVLFIFKNKNEHFYEIIELTLRANKNLSWTFRGKDLYVGYGNLNLINRIFNDIL